MFQITLKKLIFHNCTSTIDFFDDLTLLSVTTTWLSTFIGQLRELQVIRTCTDLWIKQAKRQ